MSKLRFGRHRGMDIEVAVKSYSRYLIEVYIPMCGVH